MAPLERVECVGGVERVQSNHLVRVQEIQGIECMERGSVEGVANPEGLEELESVGRQHQGMVASRGGLASLSVT